MIYYTAQNEARVAKLEALKLERIAEMINNRPPTVTDRILGTFLQYSNQYHIIVMMSTMLIIITIMSIITMMSTINNDYHYYDVYQIITMMSSNTIIRSSSDYHDYLFHHYNYMYVTYRRLPLSAATVGCLSLWKESLWLAWEYLLLLYIYLSTATTFTISLPIDWSYYTD